MKLDENEAKQIAKKIDEEGALYVKKYIATQKDELTLVLRTHLVMEKLIDEILTAILVGSEEILKMTFSQKVKLVGALGVTQNKIIKKLQAFNILRNKFAHKLDYIVESNDLGVFYEETSLIRGLNGIPELIQASAWIIYFLMGVREYYLVLPFYMGCHDNKERLKRDKGFDLTAIDEIYKVMNLGGYLNSMRLPPEE